MFFSTNAIIFKMNLKKILQLSIIFLVSSCGPSQASIGIAVNPNLPNVLLENDSVDDWTIRIDLDALTLLSESDEYFLVYIGNPTCSSCIRFQPQLMKWIHETKASVYYFDTLEHLHHLSNFQVQFPSYFPEGFSTPTLSIFLGETRMHRISASEAFFSYPRFEALMKTYIYIIE